MKESALVFYIFDDLNRMVDIVILKQNGFCGALRQLDFDSGKKIYSKKFVAAYKVDGYFLSEFMGLLNVSEVYYRLVVNNFSHIIKSTPDNGDINVKVQLVKPKSDFMDHNWNDRICKLLAERQNLEHTMSWLSTLGGAFSALGDSFQNCAKVAGKISVQQFKIAFRLGEPPLVARCRLYLALSLIQLGKLGAAKNLVLEQFKLSKDFNDSRLKNMCHGVWSKLQYVYKLKKIQKKKYCN